MHTPNTIRFIDPSNLTRYKDSLYLYERTILSLTKYLEYLRHNNNDLAVKISFTGGTEESPTAPSGSLVKVNEDILSVLGGLFKKLAKLLARRLA